VKYAFHTPWSHMEKAESTFEFTSPTTVLFGKRSFTSQLRGNLPAKTAHVLLVFGGETVRSLGLLDELHTALDSLDIKVHEYGGVSPNPSLSHCIAGGE
jgi:alcohol dehydrogenase